MPIHGWQVPLRSSWLLLQFLGLIKLRWESFAGPNDPLGLVGSIQIHCASVVPLPADLSAVPSCLAPHLCMQRFQPQFFGVRPGASRE